MVASSATATTRKRGKADDMAESPPKRVTRARAAKSTDEPTTDGPMSKRITTASARVAGAKKTPSAAKATKPVTRKKADNQETAAEKTEEKAEKSAKPTARTRAGSKKDEDTEMETEAIEAPKTRTRRAATATKNTESAPKVTKPSTRTKRAAEKGPEATVSEKAKQEEPKRSTRGRPVAATTRSTTSTATRATAPRKKVMFKDEADQDKENIPVTKGGVKKPTAKLAAGIKAKPVRRVAPIKSALRSKKVEDAPKELTPANTPMPLSPKKIHQVAKSWSGSSEDELCQATPSRALSKSPVKAPLSARKPVHSSSEEAAAVPEPRSPSKEPPGSVMKSPARRPPASPFKDALRESPKKFLFELKQGKGDIQELGQSLFKDALKQSPKKASFIASLSPGRQLQPTQTPLKASLLASPARRPSPEKAALMISPGKSTLALPAIDKSADSAGIDAMQVLPSTPGRALTSPVKAAKAAAESVDNLQKDSVEGMTEVYAELIMNAQGSDCMLVETADGALTPPGHPEPTKTEVPISDTPKFRSAPSLDDSESEDELVSFQSMKRTPARRTRRSNRYRTSAVTPATTTLGENMIPASAKAADLAITPLAVQLSSWLASSPEKQEEQPEDDQLQSIFHHVGASASKRESSSSADSGTTVVINSPKFFADQMAVRDLEAVEVHEDQRGEIMMDSEMIDAEDADLERASQSTEQFGDENAMPENMATHIDTYVLMEDGETTPLAIPGVEGDDSLLDAQEMAGETVIVKRATAEETSHRMEAEVAVVTPVRRSPLRRREVHTVSKVPLRAEGGRSPIKILKKRSKSLAYSLESSEDVPRQVLGEKVIPVANDQAVQDEAMEGSDVFKEASTPRAVLSENPPATMPAKARKVQFQSEGNGSPTKIPKKRSKSMAHALEEQDQDPQTYLAPSTSFATQEAEAVNGDSAEAATPRAVLSEVPPATMPANTRKVPLRPEGECSPIKVPKKRGKSMGIPSNQTPVSVGSLRARQSFVNIQPAQPKGTNTAAPGTPQSAGATTPQPTPSPDTLYGTITPAKPVRTGPDAQILRGAVVFVDVHTTEGADASGIFVDLLAQMGAKCVKQWTWNPRASVSGGGLNSPEDLAKSGKVGITHVIFKDGGKRTLQKVREAKGLVLCVGVGWVLECVILDSLSCFETSANQLRSCEHSNQWLDEAAYAVDTSTIPRGGHNRRKSMEPRALSNLNGSLVLASSGATTTPRRSVSYEFSPTKSLFDGAATPAAGQRSPASDSGDVSIIGLPAAPVTPSGDGASTWGSPTTPYFLSKGATLMQQTCPPKQTMQGLFPVSGNIDDEPDMEVRKKLLAARRKSLQWAPKVGSPLGRAVSYGK